MDSAEMHTVRKMEQKGGGPSPTHGVRTGDTQDGTAENCAGWEGKVMELLERRTQITPPLR